MMKITVCELNDDPMAFAEDWEALAAHVKVEGSQLVVLPEMPFAPWFTLSPRYDASVWQAAVRAHAARLIRLEELARAIQSAVTDPGIRQRAVALGEALRAEDGVGKVVEIVKRYLGGGTGENLHIGGC